MTASTAGATTDERRPRRTPSPSRWSRARAPTRRPPSPAAMAARQVTVGSGPRRTGRCARPASSPPRRALLGRRGPLGARRRQPLGRVRRQRPRRRLGSRSSTGGGELRAVCAARAGHGPGAVAAPRAAPAPRRRGFIDEEESTMVFSNAQDLVRAAEQMHAARPSAPAVPQLPAIPGMPGGPSARPATMAPQRSAPPHSYPPPARAHPGDGPGDAAEAPALGGHGDSPVALRGAAGGRPFGGQPRRTPCRR
jgi:hypothetical protein